MVDVLARENLKRVFRVATGQDGNLMAIAAEDEKKRIETIYMEETCRVSSIFRLASCIWTRRWGERHDLLAGALDR